MMFSRASGTVLIVKLTDRAGIMNDTHPSIVLFYQKVRSVPSMQYAFSSSSPPCPIRDDAYGRLLSSIAVERAVEVVRRLGGPQNSLGDAQVAKPIFIQSYGQEARIGSFLPKLVAKVITKKKGQASLYGRDTRRPVFNSSQRSLTLTRLSP